MFPCLFWNGISQGDGGKLALEMKEKRKGKEFSHDGRA
jgi:hypothetical protein